MTDRRDFLGVLAALAGTGIAPRRGPRHPGVAPTVHAAATVFHGHPEGQTTLVRFAITETDAVAGRLRVFDRRNRLVGTAGLLRGRDGLAGELWVPLARRTTLRSELEMPGTRRPIRTRHILDPRPRWTIHWLTLADPDDLAARLAATPLLTRGALTAGLIATGVRGDPVAGARLTNEPDHLDVLRAAIPAIRLAERSGIPMATLGVMPEPPLPYLPMALANVGVPRTVAPVDVGPAEALGFGAGRPAMVRRIEAWLGTRAAPSGRPEPVALLIGTDLDAAMSAGAAVREWNSMFAFPRLVAADPSEVPAGAAGRSGAPASIPGAAVLTRIASERRKRRRERVETVFTPLTRTVTPSAPSLEAVARRFAFPVSGALVFNPSPFGRSDVVAMPDGSRRVVTDVPGLGYAFIPDGTSATGSATATTDDGQRTAGNEAFRVTVDSTTGGLASIVAKTASQELVRAGGNANAVEGARLERVRHESLPGIGEQLVVERSTPRGPVSSRVVLARGVPWIEIVNEVTAVEADRTYGFALSPDVRTLEWEVAGGAAIGSPPAALFSHLRWIAARGQRGSVLFATPDTGFASYTETAGLVAHAAGGAVRFRLGFQAFAVADDPWRFGWSVEPFRAFAVDGTGDLALPTFGRLFEVRDPGVAIMAIRPARDGVGAIAYLQELLGVAREVQLAPGILTFERVLRTDLAERDVAELGSPSAGGVSVPVAAYGFTALRLLGMRLAG